MKSFVAGPSEKALLAELRAALDERNVRYEVVPSVADAFAEADVIYMERRNDAIVLHSLPRMDESPIEVDLTRHARYWEEAHNGVVMRMAMLCLVLGAME